MSTGEIYLLGAIAGFTILLGLPVGRLRNVSTGTAACLNAGAAGVLATPMALILTKHAHVRMARDGIKAAWVETIIRQPQHSMPDPLNPALTQAWRRQ